MGQQLSSYSHHNFDFPSLLVAFSKYVGFFGRDLNLDLDWKEKEEIYQRAHARVKKLREEYHRISSRLFLKDYHFAGWVELKGELKRIRGELVAASVKASDEVFEQV
jgi:hypothetical protein